MKSLVRSIVRGLGYDILAVQRAPWTRTRAIGGHEQLLRDFQARGFFPNCILDVGANRGEWAGMAARVFPKACFILIEPQQEMKLWLDAFVGSHPGSVLHCVAAGAENATLPMAIWPNGDGSSFLLTDEQARELNVVRRDMPVRTIDSLITTAESQIPELAKFDIQGYEIEALKGAQSLLESTEVIILEVTFFTEPEGADFAAVVCFMNDAGYKLYDFCGFAPRPCDNALGQADAVFVRSAGRFRRHLGWQ